MRKRDAVMQDAVGTCLPCLYDDGQPGGGEDGEGGGAGGEDVHGVQLRGSHLLPVLPLGSLAVPKLHHLTHQHLPWHIHS